MTKENSRKAVLTVVILGMLFTFQYFIKSSNYVSGTFIKFIIMVILPVFAIPSNRCTHLGFRKGKLGQQILLGILFGVLVFFTITAGLGFPIKIAAGDEFIGYNLRHFEYSLSEFTFLPFQFFHSSIEEVVYRGYLTGYITENLSGRAKIPWIIFIALLFGLGHITPLSIGSLPGIIYRFVITGAFSLVVSLLYLKVKNFTLLSAMFTHIFYNYCAHMLI